MTDPKQMSAEELVDAFHRAVYLTAPDEEQDAVRAELMHRLQIYRELTGEIEIKELLGGNVTFSHPMFRVWADSMYEMFKEAGGENYVELTLMPKNGGPMTLTLQRQEGKTPDELLRKYKSDVSEALHRASLELSSNYGKDADHCFWEAYDAALKERAKD